MPREPSMSSGSVEIVASGAKSPREFLPHYGLFHHYPTTPFLMLSRFTLELSALHAWSFFEVGPMQLLNLPTSEGEERSSTQHICA